MRGWAELLAQGGTKIRFHWPCGHSEVKDYGKGPIPKRMGPTACAMMASWWRQEAGGVNGTCKRCKAKHELAISKGDKR